MHASPQRLHVPDPGELPSLRPVPPRHKLGPAMLRFFRLLRISFWRAFVHDSFAIAKASAYSSIFTFFPVLVIVGSVLANWRKGAPYLREISYALGNILPAGSNTALNYLKSAPKHPLGFLLTTSIITLWLASGVMISWMEGFRRCYELPKIWGLVKERLIALALVILAGIPLTFATILVVFGSRIELAILSYLDRDLGFFVLLMWMFIRWLIAILTSVSVIALIYHNAVPRTQPWHSVLPGATLATGMWFVVTMIFGWYLQNYADYSVIYGSLGAAIALLVWMYMISLVILIGAEFNAILFPRSFLGKELKAMPAPQTATK